MCIYDEKDKYWPHHVDNYTVFREQDIGSKPDHMDQYNLNKSILCCTPVTDETNQNISGAHKEFLHWIQKLCLNLQDIQHLMKPQNVCNQEGNIITKRPPTIPTK